MELDITELEIDLKPRHKGLGGNRETFPSIFGWEPIDEEELYCLIENKPHRSRSNIQQIRSTHHAYARLVAAGFKDVEIAEVCHTSSSNISQLKTDPSFQELVAQYQQLATDEAFDFRSALSVLGHRGLGALSKMLDAHEEGEGDGELSPNFLKSLTMDLLDRIGHSPLRRSVSTNEHRHEHTILDAKEIADIKAEVSQRRGDIFQKLHAEEAQLVEGEQQLSLPQGGKTASTSGDGSGLSKEGPAPETKTDRQAS